MPSAHAILRGVCPRRRTGAIYRRSLFRGWLDIHDRCPVCGLRFEREQGYYLGAMYVSYQPVAETGDRRICPKPLICNQQYTDLCCGQIRLSPVFTMGCYALSVPPVALLVLLIWLITRWRLDYVVLSAFVAYLPAVPAVVRFSRIVWIHIDQWLDPEKSPATSPS